MFVDVVIYVLVGVLFIAGLILFIYREKNLNTGQKLQAQIDIIKGQFKGRQDNILTGTRYYFDKDVYHGIRFAGSVFLLGYGFRLHNPVFLVLAATLLLLTIPKSSVKGIKMPFFYFNKLFGQHEKRKADSELLELIGFLKNLTTLQSRNSVGADYIISELASVAEFTRPAFLMMLNKLRLNRKAEAYEAFSFYINTELGRDLAHLLIELDELKPRELQEVILMQQRQAQSIKSTRIRRSDETVSVLVYLPVIAAIMVIFLNFVVMIQMEIGNGFLQ